MTDACAMPKLKRPDIAEEVLTAIRGAARVGSLDDDAPEQRSFLTAYQILERLPAAIRNKLIKAHGKADHGDGNYVSAATFVARTAMTIPSVATAWLDTKGLSILVDGKPVVGGSPVCALYSLRESDD